MFTTFDYDKALAAVRDNQFAMAFLECNRQRLEELGTAAGEAVLLEIIDLFASGRELEAWRRFYSVASGDGSDAWATLAHGAADDVTATAEMAQQWSQASEFIRRCGIAATRVLLAVVLAGFCG